MRPDGMFFYRVMSAESKNVDSMEGPPSIEALQLDGSWTHTHIYSSNVLEEDCSHEGLI